MTSSLNLTETEAGLVVAVDTSYLLLTGMNILLMQGGFLALEAGGTRAKNVKSLLFKNFMDHAVGALAWFSVGWGLFIGASPFVAGEGSTFFVHPIGNYARLFQQFAFAATASTIVSGAVTGRCRLEPYVVLSAFMAGLAYPIAAHWAWADFGWLRNLGFLDFAGSCVVHAFGGAVAFVGAAICGPRPGRFVVMSGRNSPNIANSESSTLKRELSAAMREDEAVESAPKKGSKRAVLARRFCGQRKGCLTPIYQTRVMPKGFNPPMMALGALLLYVAWFSFNAGSSGSTFYAPDGAARAAVNTMLAAGAASLCHMVLTLLAGAKYDIEAACNSMLSGLVAITAPCGYVDPWAAVVVGLLATPCYLISAWFVLKVLGVDDVLGAVSVHYTCGILGTLWLGLTHPVDGLFYSGNPKLLGVQALGSLCIPTFGALTCLIFIFIPFRMANRLCYTQSEQLIGIDFVHFGGEYGKDVDLESDYRGHRRNSVHSDGRDDTESNDGKSNNSSFVEELPASMFSSGGEHSIHRTGNNANAAGGSWQGPQDQGASRTARSLSTNTFVDRKNVNAELRRVLDEDPRVRHRFRAYLEVMHKDEGVAFWDEVTRWKNISAKKYQDKKIKAAKRIISMYCLESASKQVNLASKLVTFYNGILDNREELIKNSLFDAALDELFRDLKDDFMEFVNNTPAYWV